MDNIIYFGPYFGPATKVLRDKDKNDDGYYPIVPRHSSATPFPFLYLPQLRNKVYGYILDNVSDKKFVPLIHPQRAMQQGVQAPRFASNWSSFQRGYLGFTQVNRQIREEFTIAYDLCHAPMVQVRDLYLYLTDIVAQGFSNRKILGMQEKSTHAIDIRPLLLIDFPNNTEYKFTEGLTLLRLMIEQVMYHSAWKDYTMQCTSRVLLHVVRDEDKLENVASVRDFYIIVKPECAEDWMWVQGLDMDERHFREKKGWKNQKGSKNKKYIEGLQDWKDVMDVGGQDLIWVVADKNLAGGPLG